MENDEIVNKFPKSGQIALPFNEDQFKDFIVSLLGKPQTITKNFNGSFTINKENIIGLFELINQRIFQQNDAKLIQFRATIYYDDNSTVTLNGFDHLINYNERLPLISIAVHLTFQFLVKFRDKETFEKQEITISFITSHSGPIPEIDGNMFMRHYENEISFRISHTARTWGADMEGLLSRNIKTYIKTPSKFAEFFIYNFDKVEHLITSLLLCITLIFCIFKTLKLPKNISINDLISHYGNLIFLFSGIYILIKITSIFLEIFDVRGKPSFVILTPESEKNKIMKLKSYRKDWLKYGGTIIISLILGILSNYLYYELFVN